jgi:hypothetical protein
MMVCMEEKGEHILMCEFESTSACGESALVKCGVS